MEDFKEQGEEYILLAKGTLKRAIIWRAIRILSHLFVFSWAVQTFGPKTEYVTQKKAGIPPGVFRPDQYESVAVMGGGSTFSQILAAIIGIAIVHYLLNFLYRGFVFEWVFKLPYTQENESYVKRAVR